MVVSSSCAFELASAIDKRPAFEIPTALHFYQPLKVTPLCAPDFASAIDTPTAGLVHEVAFPGPPVTWGPFLERPGNFSGPKSHFKNHEAFYIQNFFCQQVLHSSKAYTYAAFRI